MKYKLFSNELNKALNLKYKSKKISAFFFARQFNLECKKSAHLNISQETARKWLKGLSFPSQERLMLLIFWLKLDSRFFYIEDIAHEIETKDLKEALVRMSEKLLEMIKQI
jgi:hypothetical protein